MWNGNEATVMSILDFPVQKRPERSVLRVEGPEARTFLHGLLTCDVEGMAGLARYGALLSPQGKILFDLFIVDAGHALLVDCAASQKADLLKRLAMYKLRAKVTIAAADELEVGVSHAAQPGAWRDPRSDALGWRMIVAKGTLGEDGGYHRARIMAGLADTDADLGSGEFFPHEANFDQFGAVSFSKGCYIGQEVVSRMEHRGTARARILPAKFDGAAAAKGSDIRTGEKSIGTVLGSDGDMALALIRLDRLAEAASPLLSEGVRVTVLKPTFARYDVPGIKD